MSNRLHILTYICNSFPLNNLRNTTTSELYYLPLSHPIYLFTYIIKCIFFFSSDSEINLRHAELITIHKSVTDMLETLCDNVHERCSKVLTARAKVTIIFVVF